MPLCNYIRFYSCFILYRLTDKVINLKKITANKNGEISKKTDEIDKNEYVIIEDNLDFNNSSKSKTRNNEEIVQNLNVVNVKKRNKRNSNF